MATQAIVATVVGTAALCDALRSDTGLIAAIVMGVALANLPVIDLPEDRAILQNDRSAGHRSAVHLYLGRRDDAVRWGRTVADVSGSLPDWCWSFDPQSPPCRRFAPHCQDGNEHSSVGWIHAASSPPRPPQRSAHR